MNKRPFRQAPRIRTYRSSPVFLILSIVGTWLVLLGLVFAQPNPSANTPKVPASADELFTYLQSGAYRAFPHESAPHASVGPHGQVQTYLNPVLEASISAGNEAHPVGAAAVKELYEDGVVTGWAVYVKTQAESDGGNGFYWYEVFSATDPSAVAVDGQGEPGCTGCHSAGRDFTLSSFPLQ